MKDFQLLLKKIKNKLFKESVKKTKSYQKTFHHFTWYLLLEGILCMLFLLIGVDFTLHQEVSELTVVSAPFILPSPADYPQITSSTVPEISALSGIVMDDASKVILYEKNPDMRFSPASTVKIMTAITALNYFKPNDILTVQKVQDTQGSGLGLFIGEKLTFENLLYGLLLPSANDAAFTIAQNCPGGEKAFIDKMNENTKIWHLENTHFADPAGLLDDKNFTTARDLIRLASIAMQNSEFAKIVATKNTVITSADKQIVYPIRSRNKLLGIYGVNGIKTGYTDEAGEVLVASQTKNGHEIILVVMKSLDRFLDTEKLLNYLSDITYISIRP